MATEITVLDFKLSNTFEEYCTHMKAPEQQAMFNEMGVKTFYIAQHHHDHSPHRTLKSECHYPSLDIPHTKKASHAEKRLFY